MRNYLQLLSNIIAQLTKKVRMLSMSVREKVSLYLIEQSRHQQTKNIILPLSRQELADHFGIQKYSLLRCLNELKQEGVIRVEGRHIQILSRL
jgi:CRP-like cAMP-binding protein